MTTTTNHVLAALLSKESGMTEFELVSRFPDAQGTMAVMLTMLKETYPGVVFYAYMPRGRVWYAIPRPNEPVTHNGVTVELRNHRWRVNGAVASKAAAVAAIRAGTEGAEGVQSGGVGVQSAARTFRSEFADFDYDLPAIPGMSDESWVNDVCPVLRDSTGKVELWCDYADPAKREIAETPRYSLAVDGDTLASGDDLDATILGALREALARAV